MFPCNCNGIHQCWHVEENGVELRLCRFPEEVLVGRQETVLNSTLLPSERLVAKSDPPIHL